jgi:DNA polymerase-4
VAVRIRDAVKESTGLDVSIGLATGKLVAKVASDAEKPRGLVYVAPGEEAAFLAPRPLRVLPGLGPKTEVALRPLGVRTLGELAALRPEQVPAALLRLVSRLQAQARGHDPRPVTPPQQPKSLSREETFSRDTADRHSLEATIRRLALGVAEPLRRAGLEARSVELKLRYTPFRTVLRSRTLPSPTNSDRVLAEAALGLFAQHFEGGSVRLVGAGAALLQRAEAQADLFGEAGARDRWVRLDRRLDALRARFGPKAIWVGAAGRGHERALDWTRQDLEHASATPQDTDQPGASNAEEES